MTEKTGLSSSDSYYDLLNISCSATDEEIRQAYRGLALQLHPDKQNNINVKQKLESKQSNYTSFEQLQIAYETLRDEQKRQAYDLLLKQKEAAAIAAAVSGEVGLEDMTYEEDQDTYEWPCRCGTMYLIYADDLAEGIDIHNCPGCSLNIRVLYEVDDE